MVADHSSNAHVKLQPKFLMTQGIVKLMPEEGPTTFEDEAE